MAYIAQVLKRNRTLKVLNLSDNKIDPPGLTALAEALVRPSYSLHHRLAHLTLDRNTTRSSKPLMSAPIPAADQTWKVYVRAALVLPLLILPDFPLTYVVGRCSTYGIYAQHFAQTPFPR